MNYNFLKLFHNLIPLHSLLICVFNTVPCLTTADPADCCDQLLLFPTLSFGQPHFDPSGWHMSEKLDGVRAFWNGKSLLSRLGNMFPAPNWFLEALPVNCFENIVGMSENKTSCFF